MVVFTATRVAVGADRAVAGTVAVAGKVAACILVSFDNSALSPPYFSLVSMVARVTSAGESAGTRALAF